MRKTAITCIVVVKWFEHHYQIENEYGSEVKKYGAAGEELGRKHGKLPGTPYNQQVANCCRGGVLSSWVQDPLTAISSFQVSVGQTGTSNKTVRVPKNFTLKALGPGYTCGPGKIVPPSKYKSQDGRRTTQAVGVANIKLLADAMTIKMKERRRGNEL